MKKSMSDNRTFRFKDLNHIIGDTTCEKCWFFYPRPCKCGGLIHAEFDFNDDWDYAGTMTRRCDSCGLDYEEFRAWEGTYWR